MMYLIEDDLGQLDLDCDDGLVVASLEVGFPAERPVVRGRALGDGVFDDSRYVGSRVITVALRFNDDECEDPLRELQQMIDSVMAYMNPRRRPRLVWELKTGSGDERSAVVRGIDAPVIIEGQRYPIVVFQFATTTAFLELPDEVCFVRDPNEYVPEPGRVYPLTFDRVYPPTVPTDAVAVLNPGNAPADWVATILGPAIEPNVIVNGVPIRTDRAGGITLIGGQTLVIDTRERTVLLNNDPNESRYDRLNFEEWSWDDLLLRPGVNVFRFNGAGNWFTDATRLTICTRGAWL
jgi:hypothetical protein